MHGTNMKEKSVTYSYYNLISNWRNVEYGVPQGSVLGLLVFSLYNNDFPMLVNKISDIIMFADDTIILITSNSRDELLQRFNHILNHMSDWFHANRLILNPTKTEVLKLLQLYYLIHYIYLMLIIFYRKWKPSSSYRLAIG